MYMHCDMGIWAWELGTWCITAYRVEWTTEGPWRKNDTCGYLAGHCRDIRCGVHLTPMPPPFSHLHSPPVCPNHRQIHCPQPLSLPLMILSRLPVLERWRLPPESIQIWLHEPSSLNRHLFTINSIFTRGTLMSDNSVLLHAPESLTLPHWLCTASLPPPSYQGSIN